MESLKDKGEQEDQRQETIIPAKTAELSAVVAKEQNAEWYCRESIQQDN